MTAHYIGTPHTKWFSDGRDMLMLSDFAFVDDQGQEFWALEGETIDGASIPRFFWRMFGSPFTGLHRYAAVIHDCECRRKYLSWQTVHKGFRDAMKLSGVNWTKRNLMYRAVYRFGPRW